MDIEDAAPELRRFTKKGLATRSRILEAAAELIFDRGVARTGVEDVQTKANVSASQLYHYFGDKETLVRAVIEYQTDATLESQRPLLDQLDSMTALRAWRDQVVGIQAAANCQGGCALGSLANELSKTDVDARAQLAKSFERWEAALRLGLHAMRDRGALRRDANPDRLAMALLSALQGGIMLTELQRSTTPVATALDVMLDHIESFTTKIP